ncbi:biotin synthase [Aquabacterium sp. A3]|uniref:biotin synthase n=1 Tax=Aquabacterium sp. A3 TaxID=3132829 RepID=UPI0031196812
MPASPPVSPSAPSPHPASPHPQALARQARRLAQAGAPWLNQEVARRLADKLAPIRLQPRRWLDWSAHLGDGAAVVRQAYPDAQRLLAEPHSALAGASAATAAAQAPVGWAARLLGRRAQAPAVWVPGDGAAPPWGQEGVDLLWANMALHTAADLPGLMTCWHRALAVDGFLMASGLGPDTARELRSLYAELGWGLPTVQFVDMHDLGDELVQAGFADPVMDMERLTLTWATPEAMLAELRTWGGNVAVGRFAGWRTPRWRERWLAAAQERLVGGDGRLSLTVELVYAHAVKPVPRAMVAPETRVSLDDMRQMMRRSGKP